MIENQIPVVDYCQWPIAWDDVNHTDFWCAVASVLFTAADFTLLHHIQGMS